ncbi:MAG TPA: hypothetical protein VFV70_15195 [Hyphomonadaceae bacterium]|nr:hypothetical protein [Hyphomonadaceae bacterium]
MADSTHLLVKEQFDTDEADELRVLARRLAEDAPEIASAVCHLLRTFDDAVASSQHPAEAELAAETFARRLRAAWLTAAGAEAASVYRSPTAREARQIARHHDAFGYERDLQPESLEARCRAFFPSPPAGWRQDHILFSSGQAAMTSALLALGGHLAPGGQLRVMHRGAYFETTSLLRQLSFLDEATFAQAADLVIDEPVCCDGQFHQIDTGKLLASGASPPAVIFDTTLQGRDDGIDRYLAALDPHADQTVLRVTSCLKLFEAGLELANAGILSVYQRSSIEKKLCEDIRRVRTLTGAGLNLVDVIALEAPFFLDPAYADRYARPVFDNNARLINVVAESNKRFVPISHPALVGGDAPYCAFQLLDASPEAWDALENEIASEIRRRSLVFAHGGSFGFRGHRYEIVRPETGAPPFLRIALGRRGGWSCDGIIEMRSGIAAK